MFNAVKNKFMLGTSFLGTHTCICGKQSGPSDLLIRGEIVTNSLAYHYVSYHWIEIPPEEVLKLEILKALYEIEIEDDSPDG